MRHLNCHWKANKLNVHVMLPQHMIILQAFEAENVWAFLAESGWIYTSMHTCGGVDEFLVFIHWHYTIFHQLSKQNFMCDCRSTSLRNHGDWPRPSKFSQIRSLATLTCFSLYGIVSLFSILTTEWTFQPHSIVNVTSPNCSCTLCCLHPWCT